MRQFTCVISLVILMMSIYTDAPCQLLMRRHAKKSELPPKVILVQLPTYENRMEYFKKANKTESLQLLKKDADSMQSKIIADFNDNVNYCPVYYFYDRDLDKIRSKEFSGVVMNSQLEPLNNPIITANDSSYFIALFGHVIQQGNNTKSEGTATAGYNVASNKQKLQVLDHRYNKVQKPLPSGTNNAWGGKPKRSPEFYKYESSKFDIYYIPYAANFNSKLHVFYGKYPY